MMRGSEITRIVVLVFIGALLMFVLQPLLYTRGLIFLSDIDDPASWVSEYYMRGALTVFCACAIATLVWLWFTATSTKYKGDQIDKTRPVWWIIGLIPLASIGLAIGFLKGSNDALSSLTFFYVIDVFLLYWLTTAINTPGNFRYIPPFSETMRNLIGDK